jgi:MFS family permease
VPRIRVLTFCVMTGLLASGYGVMFTVLDDFRDEYGIAAGWLGTIVGIGFISSFVAQVFIAPIADRGHARLLVVLGLLLSVAGLLGMAAGKVVWVLLVARFVMGVGAGMASPAVRRIVINADPDRLGHNVGLLLAADVAGFALGPVVSAVLVPWLGIPAPFLLIAALSLASVPIVLRVPVSEATDLPATRFAFDLLSSRAMLAGLLLGAALFLMIGTFDALWAIVLDDLGAAELIANLGIVIFALPLIFLGSFGGRLAQRLGPFRLGPIGLAMGAVFMFLYGLMPTGLTMLAVGVVHALSDGLTVTSTSVAVGMVAPPERQAGAQGMLGAAETLTGGVVAVGAGLLYESGGRTLAYSTCAVLMLGMCVAAWMLAGPEYRARTGSDTVVAPEPAHAVSGHA